MRTTSPTSKLINMILSDTRLMSYTFVAPILSQEHTNATCALVVANPEKLVSGVFQLCVLPKPPLHLTSCTQQRSMFLLVMVSTISLDLPHGTDVPGGNLKGAQYPEIEENLIKHHFSKNMFFNLEFIVESESEEIILIALMVFELYAYL